MLLPPSRRSPQVSTQWLMAAMRGLLAVRVLKGELLVEALKVEWVWVLHTMGELLVEALKVDGMLVLGWVMALLLRRLGPARRRRTTRNGPST